MFYKQEDHHSENQKGTPVNATFNYLRNFLKFFQWAALFFCIILVGWYFKEIVTYIILALVVAAVLRTPANYLSSLQIFGIRLPRGIAVLVSFLLMIGIVSLFIYLFIPLVSEQIKVLSRINFLSLLNALNEPIHQVEDFLIEHNLSNNKEGFLRESLIESVGELVQKFRLTSLLNSLLAITGNFFVGLMAVMFIAFFFLYEPGMFKKFFISLIPNKYFEVSIAAVSKTEHLLSNYLLGLSLQMLSIFSIASLGLLLVNIEYAVTIAVFAAVANLIPYMGPILGGSFGLIVGLLTTQNLDTTQDYIILVVKIASVFGAVQLTDNVLLQPMIFSRSVKTHPLVIFLTVFVGAALGGIPGMVAAIPTFTIFRVTISEFWKGYKEYQIFRS